MRGKNTKFNFYLICAFFVGTLFVVSIAFNQLVLHTQIDVTSAPSVVNGITTSTSIIMGFSGAIIGILYDVFKRDSGARVYLLAMACFLAIPLVLLYTVYSFLAMGLGDLAVRGALDDLVLSFSLFIFTMLFAFHRLTSGREKKENLEKASSDKAESDKPKPDENKTTDQNNKERIALTEKTEKDEILKLIRLIDKKKYKLFKPSDILLGSSLYPFSAIAGLVFLIEVFLVFGPYNLYDKLAVGLIFLTFVVAVLALLAQWGEENIVKINFERALKLLVADGNIFDENRKLLLKALIKTKSKNPEFDLEEVYKKNGDLFTEKKLMEKLLD